MTAVRRPALPAAVRSWGRPASPSSPPAGPAGALAGAVAPWGGGSPAKLLGSGRIREPWPGGGVQRSPSNGRASCHNFCTHPVSSFNARYIYFLKKIHIWNNNILFLLVFFFKLWFRLLRRNYTALKHLQTEISSVRPTGRGREGHSHIIRSTRATEEAEKRDRHLEVTGHAMKPSQPNAAMVERAANSNCDESIWNVLEVLSS